MNFAAALHLCKFIISVVGPGSYFAMCLLCFTKSFLCKTAISQSKAKEKNGAEV